VKFVITSYRKYFGEKNNLRQKKEQLLRDALPGPAKVNFKCQAKLFYFYFFLCRITTGSGKTWYFIVLYPYLLQDSNRSLADILREKLTVVPPDESDQSILGKL
jgi:hypothetical protein